MYPLCSTFKKCGWNRLYKKSDRVYYVFKACVRVGFTDNFHWLLIPARWSSSTLGHLLSPSPFVRNCVLIVLCLCCTPVWIAYKWVTRLLDYRFFLWNNSDRRSETDSQIHEGQEDKRRRDDSLSPIFKIGDRFFCLHEMRRRIGPGRITHDFLVTGRSRCLLGLIFS